MAGNLDSPKRPKFSWEIRSVPWTDGRGDHAEHVDIVKSWWWFHDKLPDSNRYKIPNKLRGILLQSYLYGCAKDLCKDLLFEEIESEDEVDKICNTLYKKWCSWCCEQCLWRFPKRLINKVRKQWNFSAAAIAKMRSHRSITLFDSLTVFTLLENSDIDTNQRMSILSVDPSHRQNSVSTTSDE